jgi:hypothetical protein
VVQGGGEKKITVHLERNRHRDEFSLPSSLPSSLSLETFSCVWLAGMLIHFHVGRCSEWTQLSTGSRVQYERPGSAQGVNVLHAHIPDLLASLGAGIAQYTTYHTSRLIYIYTHIYICS